MALGSYSARPTGLADIGMVRGTVVGVGKGRVRVSSRVHVVVAGIGIRCRPLLRAREQGPGMPRDAM